LSNSLILQIYYKYKGDVQRVADRLGVDYMRAIHLVDQALNETTKGMDFSKYRERLPK